MCLRCISFESHLPESNSSLNTLANTGLWASGKNLTIEAKGTLSEDIKDGATVHLQVKYGLIRLINQEADLCKQVKNVDLECPLKKGETNMTKTVELPKQIPPVPPPSFLLSSWNSLHCCIFTNLIPIMYRKQSLD